jgi:hypothetical protein
MKPTFALLILATILLAVPGFATAQTNSPPSRADSASQTWLTNYYGKTLSSLGEIVTIRIGRKARTTPDWTHRELWQIIELSKLKARPVASVPLGVPPVFFIEYADGLRLQADRFNVVIHLPDGRKGPLFLDSTPPAEKP